MKSQLVRGYSLSGVVSAAALGHSRYDVRHTAIWGGVMSRTAQRAPATLRFMANLSESQPPVCCAKMKGGLLASLCPFIGDWYAMALRGAPFTSLGFTCANNPAMMQILVFIEMRLRTLGGWGLSVSVNQEELSDYQAKHQQTSERTN